jgi:hypothetical protein
MKKPEATRKGGLFFKRERLFSVAEHGTCFAPVMNSRAPFIATVDKRASKAVPPSATSPERSGSQGSPAPLAPSEAKGGFEPLGLGGMI